MVSIYISGCTSKPYSRVVSLLTAEQIDKIIKDTMISTIRSKSPADTTTDIQWISSEKDCADMVAKMEAGIAK